MGENYENYTVKKATAADAVYGKHLGTKLDHFLKYIHTLVCKR